MKSKALPRVYNTPIYWPERSVGDFAVRHKLMERQTLVTMREAILTGRQPATVQFSGPRLTHYLQEGDGVWMSDEVSELWQMHEAVRPLHGRVLIGGLGLGIATVLALRKKHVQEVVTVERQREVTQLCPVSDYFARCSVVLADVADFLRDDTAHFDAVMLDTWAGTGESTWWYDVLPLVRLARQRYGDRVTLRCWALGWMRTQVLNNLLHGAEHWLYRGLGINGNAKAARAFFDTAGTKKWEARWGSTVDDNFQRDSQLHAAAKGREVFNA